MSRKKVVVVGAGPGGLVASILLASNGYDVHVFEQNDYVGGRNSSLMLGDYRFDLGPTFFMMPDILSGIFRQTGRTLTDYVTLTEIDPLYRLSFNGGTYEFLPSRNRRKMQAAMEELAPGSFRGYLKYMEKESIKYERLAACFRMPYGRLIDYLKKEMLTAVPYLDAHKSVYDVLGRYFKNPYLKLSFTSQAKYIGMSPWQAPGTFSIIPYAEHAGGIYHVEGGLNRLSEAMARVVQEEGGKIHLGTKVERVVVEKKTAKHVVLENGEWVSADYVIINADFAHAMTHLVDKKKRRKYSDRKLEKKKYSCSTFMLYLGVNKVYHELPHHNIVFADDYKSNVDDITKRKVLSTDFSFYFQNASVTDNTLAPEGKSTIYVLVPVPNNKSDIDWPVQKERFRSKVIFELENRGGLTDLSRYIEEEKIITPADWENDYAIYKGATFNLCHNVGQMLYMRPHNEFEEFKNCYLVGGGTHPGSGLPAICQSGKISAELIMKRDRGK